MSSNPESELVSFHQFVAGQLQQEGGDVSPEEALDLWRSRHPAAGEFEDAVSAVVEALQDMEAGDRGVEFEQFDREFREGHKL